MVVDCYMKKILVIHGPNLKKTGFRETDQYGKITLEEINKKIVDFCVNHNVTVEIFQSNSEGAIIDKIEISAGKIYGLIINPGAYTHYSYAIRDAIVALNVPTIEVHMSNIYAREEFRQKSVIAPVCIGQISGFNYNSYLLAIEVLLQ